MLDIGVLKFDTKPSRVQGLYWKHSTAFISELSNVLSGKKVLEIFAGNGYLASILQSKKIDVKATSVLSSMDAHDQGLYHPVEELNAVQAVLKYRDNYDVLLMSWPTTTEQAFVASMYWGKKPIVFIGEVTNYANGQLGGCATDKFFEHFEIEMTLNSYPGHSFEKALVGKIGVANPKFNEDSITWNKMMGRSSNLT